MAAIANSVRRARWLIAAFILLAMASFLMTVRQKQTPVAKQVEFPRPNVESMRRSQSRLMQAPVAPTDLPGPRAARDPMLAALPPDGEFAVVVEAAAVRDSPLGEFARSLPRGRKSTRS